MPLGLTAMAVCTIVVVGSAYLTRNDDPLLQSSTEAAAPSTRATDAGGPAPGAPSSEAPQDTVGPGSNEPGPVAVVVQGERLVLEGTVDSEELRDTFFVAVSQLADDDLTVENNLRVEPGVGTELAISLQVTDTVLFDSDSAEISDDFAGLLTGVASALALSPGSEVRIVGHTDITGDEDLNQVLSLARASAVVDFLVIQGVPPDQLEAVGHGSSRPIADNSTPEGRQQNRRIEIEIDMKSEDQ
jgi:outer membrane protein OmpA-like peptidoglycan-associated protein